MTQPAPTLLGEGRPQIEDAAPDERRESDSRARRAAAWFSADRFALAVLVIGLAFGLAFVFVIPPTQGSDEPSHFLRAYTIGGGNLIADELDGRYGATIDDCVPAYLEGQYSRAVAPAPLAPSRFDDVLQPCTGEARFVAFDNTASYSPVGYAFHAPGVFIGRAAGLSIAATYYLGRLTGVIGYVIAVAMAVRVSPRAKPALAVIALLPMSLTVAATYNSDGVTVAASLLVVGAFLSLRLGEGGRSVLWLFGVALTVLCIAKPAYAVMTPLALLLPERALGRRTWIWRLAFVGVPVVLAGLWYVDAAGATDVSAPAGVDVGEQLRHVLESPLGFADVLASTLIGSGRDTPFVDGFVMVFGWNRSGGAFWRPPLLLVVAGYVLVVVASLADGSRRAVGSARETMTALVPMALFVLGSLAVLTVFYLTWTPVGEEGIGGLQGRYWLPLAALPAASLAMLREPRIEPPLRVAPYAAGATVLLAIVTVKSMLIFY